MDIQYYEQMGILNRFDMYCTYENVLFFTGGSVALEETKLLGDGNSGFGKYVKIVTEFFDRLITAIKKFFGEMAERVKQKFGSSGIKAPAKVIAILDQANGILTKKLDTTLGRMNQYSTKLQKAISDKEALSHLSEMETAWMQDMRNNLENELNGLSESASRIDKAKLKTMSRVDISKYGAILSKMENMKKSARSLLSKTMSIVNSSSGEVNVSESQVVMPVRHAMTIFSDAWTKFKSILSIVEKYGEVEKMQTES